MLLSKLPPGFRYYLGAEARLRRSVVDSAMSVFEGWSYEEVLTPSLDYYALFEQGMGKSEAQTSFRFTDSDGRMISLRPDVTSSVARVAATVLADRERPLRLCYAAPVFRQQQQSHAEWRRENTHLGCELIGVDGSAADLEILLVAAEILNRIGLGNSYCITMNDVGIFNGLMKELELSETACEELRRLIDTRDGSELQTFLTRHSIAGRRSEALTGLAQLNGKGEVLDKARSVLTNSVSLAALERLEVLWRVIESLDLQDSFEIDLADVSGLNYYTGLSMKVFVKEVGHRVGRGGRYNDLTANFGNTEPAVGFVIHLDPLVEVIGRHTSTRANGAGEVCSINAGNLNVTFEQALQRRANNEQIRIESLE